MQTENVEYDTMIQAAWNCNLRVLEGLVAQVKMGDLDSRGSGPGYGAAHFAAAMGNVEVMELLLANGIDKNARDAEGNSPLIWVVTSNGPEELMESLVDHGANVNLKNFEGENALSLACQRGFADKAEYLLENGADPNNCNLDGATPLHHAAALGDVALVDLLMQWGAHVNAVDDEGDSPLHWAVREDKSDAAKRLIELGAAVSLANEDGETPIDLVLACGGQMLAGEIVGFAKLAARLPQKNSLFAPETAAADDDAAMTDEMEHGMKGLSVHEPKPAFFNGFSVGGLTC